jgi:hypothetical protein
MMDYRECERLPVYVEDERFIYVCLEEESKCGGLFGLRSYDCIECFEELIMLNDGK